MALTDNEQHDEMTRSQSSGKRMASAIMGRVRIPRERRGVWILNAALLVALAVGLQGRFAEAETIVKADLPADEAAANVAYLKQMLNRKDNPRTAAGNGKPPVVAFGQAD